jgi:integrase
LKGETINKKIHKQYIDRLENHILPYFGEMLVNKIHSKDLKDYFILKKLKSQTTINTEKRAFRILFEYAHLNKLMRQVEILDFPKIDKNKAKKRDYFTREELKIIIDNISKWAVDTKSYKSQLMRFNLIDQIYALANSGLRAGDELECIRYNQIITKNGKKFARITAGKTQTEDNYRDIPLNDVFLCTIYKTVNCSDVVFSGLFGVYSNRREGEDFIFRFDNKKTHSSKRFNQFKKWLKEKKIVDFGDSKTLYSFRHTYITAQLLNKGLPVAVISAQAGSSIAMIDKYYSKIVAEMVADEFTNYEQYFWGEGNKKDGSISKVTNDL